LTFAGCVSLAVTGVACAHDLGTVGDVYPIAEPDFLVEVKAIVKHKVDDGSWADVESKLRQDTVAALEHPAPVGNFAVASAPSIRYFDPSATLTQDILGANGQVIFAAGTTVNPLDVVRVDSNLFFFDADDPKQVAALLSAQAHSPIHVKPVAVAGSYLALARKLEQPVYFDQAANFTRRLGIAAIPALVSQDGNRLKIEEMVPQ
jgi:conjugal transfer pilus assembly protein TraW